MTDLSDANTDHDDEQRLAELDPAFSSARRNIFADDLAQPDAIKVLTVGLNDMDPEVRADAAEALGLLADPQASALLRGAIEDPDGEVRTHAAVALIRLGDDAIFPAVVRSLRHADPRVIIGAAVVLGHLRDKRVVPNLIEAFKTGHEEVGAAVAWALGQCKDPACVPWLITAVEQGFATANACEALGRIGDSRAFATLRGVLHDGSPEVRAYAARALGLLDYDPAEKADAVTPLRALVVDESRKVRLCAALSLFELGAEGSKRELQQAATP